MTNHESTHETDSHDGHSHGRTSETSSRTLAAVSAINLLGFGAELAGGLLFGSVALLSDAFHMLFDALAYVMAFAATYIADNYGDGEQWSYGLHRLEPTAAFLNGLLLLPMVGIILWESSHRYLDPIEIGTGPTLVIAFGGLLVNVASVYVLQGDRMSLNERGAFYHLIGDAGGSVAVIVSTVVVEVTGLRIVDPITAGLIAAVVAWSAVRVLRDSGAIFLQRMSLSSAELRARLDDIEGVVAVHDLHTWQVCSQLTVATVHIGTNDTTLAETDATVRRVHEELADSGVDHATVEQCSADDAHGTHLCNHGH